MCVLAHVYAREEDRDGMEVSFSIASYLILGDGPSY